MKAITIIALAIVLLAGNATLTSSAPSYEPGMGTSGIAIWKMMEKHGVRCR